MLGGMAKVTITNEGGEVHISRYSAVPLVTHLLFGRGLITTYKLCDYSDILAAQNRINSYQKGISVEWLEKTARYVFGTAYSDGAE
jgi:hypothetical protein